MMIFACSGVGLFCGTTSLRFITTLLTMCAFSKSTNAAIINIDLLNQDVRSFVIKYEQGSRTASQLISSEALQMREVVVRQAGKTEEALRAHVTQTSSKLEKKFDCQIEQGIREQLRDRLLKSLKYPGMNERANQIDKAHAHTFRWLFADANDLSYSGDLEESQSSGSEELEDENHHGEDEYSDLSMEDWFKKESPEILWNSFTDWLQSNHSIYWIAGKPGCGKSTLAKFILSEPRTKIALANWRRDAIIASHHFWRPGGLMQRSIKGMLCSIIYQLIPFLPNAIEYASANVAGLNQKDADTDWSTSELQQLCLGLIKHCGMPLCLLIDGLDECVPQDDHQKLLEILDSIRAPSVKIIALSRSEPVFEKRFRHEPQIRVQDLTAEDLLVYAKDMLPTEIQDFFLEDLVLKAEGVFLWLVLAVQDINRGFSNGDSLADLHDRAKGFPKGLKDFYKDMWVRLNGDDDLYRESAALYFKLVVGRRRSSLVSVQWGWSILDMMLASFPKTHHTFSERPTISVRHLLKECEQFHKRVRSRCAGLLGLHTSDLPWLDDLPAEDLRDGEGLREEERELLRYARKGVQFSFIHRSAYDFVLNTVEGQDILSYDPMTSEDINVRLFRAVLSAYELIGPILEEFKDYGFWKFSNVFQKLEDFLVDLSSIAHGRYRAARELTSLCYKLYISSRLLLCRQDASPSRSAAFVGIAATYPKLVGFATSILKKELAGSDVRSAVLLSVASACCNWDCNRTDLSCPQRRFPLGLVRRLLSLPEVDVNLKCPVVGMSCHYQASPNRARTATPGPFEHIMISPFAKLLSSGLSRLDWRSTKSPRNRNMKAQFLRLVSDFVFQGADLDSTLLLALRPDYLKSQPSQDRHEVLPGFFQIPDTGLSQWSFEHQLDDGILCVVALQAATVIERMLASWLKTESGCGSIKEDGHSSTEDDHSWSDLDKALSFLSQRCREFGNEKNSHVLGFLQPCGDYSHMPYRHISKEDSLHLMEKIWAFIFDDGALRDDLEINCKEVVAMSPFSTIGFRQYMVDMGWFDRQAAYELQMEYKYGIVAPLTASTFEFGDS